MSTSELAVVKKKKFEGCLVSEAEPRVAVRAAFTGIKDERHLSHSFTPSFLFPPLFLGLVTDLAH